MRDLESDGDMRGVGREEELDGLDVLGGDIGGKDEGVGDRMFGVGELKGVCFVLGRVGGSVWEEGGVEISVVDGVFVREGVMKRVGIGEGMMRRVGVERSVSEREEVVRGVKVDSVVVRKGKERFDVRVGVSIEGRGE